MTALLFSISTQTTKASRLIRSEIQRTAFCDLLMDDKGRAFANFRTHAISSEFHSLRDTWQNLGLSGDLFGNDLSEVAAILFLKGFRFHFQLLDKQVWISSDKFQDLISGSKYWRKRLTQEPMTDLKLEPQFYTKWLLILNEADLVLRPYREQPNMKGWATPSFNYFLSQFTRPQMEALLWSVYSGQTTTPSTIKQIEIENLKVLFLSGGFSNTDARLLATRLVNNSNGNSKITHKFNRYDLHFHVLRYVESYNYQKEDWPEIQKTMQTIADEMYISSRPGYLLDSYYQIHGLTKK